MGKIADKDQMLNEAEIIDKFLQEKDVNKIQVMSHVSSVKNIDIKMYYNYLTKDFHIEYIKGGDTGIEFNLKTTLEAVQKFHEIKNS